MKCDGSRLLEHAFPSGSGNGRQNLKFSCWLSQRVVLLF